MILTAPPRGIAAVECPLWYRQYFHAIEIDERNTIFDVELAIGAIGVNRSGRIRHAARSVSDTTYIDGIPTRRLLQLNPGHAVENLIHPSLVFESQIDTR